MRQRIRVFHRKSRKLTDGTLASQTARVVLRLRGALSSMDCIVFGVSDKKFNELLKNTPGVQVFPDGGEISCLAYIEEVAA